MRVRRVHISGGSFRGLRPCLLLPAVLLLTASLSDLCRLSASENRPGDSGVGRRPAPHAGSVRELIPAKYQKRYERWKAEYLSTEVGRRQWERYASDAKFMLTITVSPDLGRGGVVSEYKWDPHGNLIAATITLGSGLDGGLPPSLYYPVTSALAAAEGSGGLSGDILAAAKVAHEFGHVNRAAEDASSYQRQNRLVAQYARVFEESGYNVRDPRVVEVARVLGGTPSEIKKERELAAEANVLLFLRERLSGERGNGALFRNIGKSVREYGRGHLGLAE